MQAFYPTVELKFLFFAFFLPMHYFFRLASPKRNLRGWPYKFIFQSSGKQYGFIFYISINKMSTGVLSYPYYD